MHREPLVFATTSVVAFWLIVLTILGIHHGYFPVADLLDPQFYLEPLSAPITGALAGLFIAILQIYLHRRFTFESLNPHDKAGIRTNMGRVPIILEELASEEQRVTAEIARSTAKLANIIIKQPEPPASFLEDWYKRYAKSYPAHASLMRKLEAVLMQHRHYPATHVQDGPRDHGGRSLIEHSLLIAMLMEWNAPKFSYPADPSRPHLALLDPRYQFNSHDPLIMLAGVAHDIGKIECYEFAKDDVDRRGAPIGSRIDHDKVGARCLARMPEFWDLPDDDRDVLLLSCAYYHTPQAMPMGSPKTVRSDRLHAITELLIKWDSEGSALENREGAANREKVEEVHAESTVTPVHNARSDAGQRVLLWDVIRSVLTDPGRINGQDKRRNVGWKYHFPHLGTTLVFLVEDKFVELVAARGGLEDEMDGKFSGSGVDPLTRKILNACFEQGVLYLGFEDARTRSPDMLAYVARMYQASRYFENAKTKKVVNPVTARGKEVVTLGSVLVLEVSKDKLPELAELPDNNLVPEIKHFRTGGAGRRGRKPKTDPAATATATAEMPQDTGGWAVPSFTDKVGTVQADPAVDKRDEVEHETGDVGQMPWETTIADDERDALPGTTVTDPKNTALREARVPSKPISAVVLAELAKAAASAGAITAMTNASTGGMLIRADQDALISALGLDAFGYSAVPILLDDLRKGRIRGVELIDGEEIPIIKIAPLSKGPEPLQS